MDWLKKHADTITVLVSLALMFNWINGEFKEVRKELNDSMSAIRTELVQIKTVLIMKGIWPTDLAKGE